MYYFKMRDFSYQYERISGKAFELVSQFGQ